MGTAIKHPMPGRVKPSFVIFDIRVSARMGIKGLKQSQTDLWCWTRALHHPYLFTEAYNQQSIHTAVQAMNSTTLLIHTSVCQTLYTTSYISTQLALHNAHKNYTQLFVTNSSHFTKCHFTVLNSVSTLWCPLWPYGYSYKAAWARLG